ncbi:hypothetical protein GOAMR_04_00110 [Gordonia amarae NBRC 15530]|uniref:4Fe4S-binding SPASM domain-containing protein n=1 Tax=Gordonia amarae NBRC 15530 TaxID=1075090 RepID=G7GJB9_9ACTN|nr:hypothetical protein GOAMR_04_00110 [Gordonia amarae NBRC 15530]
MTVLPDGKTMACCGLGTQSIDELNIGHVDVDDLATARTRAEADFLKRWIRDEGPERILQWTAARDETIIWENLYAHRCQACKRVYSDPKVESVLRDHYPKRSLMS